MLNLEFICVIGTVTSYLGNWGKRINFGNDVAEIQQKYEREREKVGERKSGNAIAEIGEIFFLVTIVAMPLPKIGGKKIMVAEIWGGIKKKKILRLQ